MGKIDLLVPREEMLYQAHNIIQETKFCLRDMRCIKTEAAVAEARRSIGEGVDIIIARGLQASLIKKHTEIPVVEIMLTAQEVALLVMRAKNILGREKPAIAIVGFKNMFNDMSYFDSLYGVNLRACLISQDMSLEEAALSAIEEGAELIIGGDVAVATAASKGIPSLFLSSTEESLRQAFLIAERMDYAMSVEKKSTAHMEALLDHSANGIITLDTKGRIIDTNLMMQNELKKESEELRGRPVARVIPQITEEILEKVVAEKQEYSTYVEWNGASWSAAMVPVVMGVELDGIILICSKMARLPVKQEPRGRGLARGIPPQARFEDILQKSKNMQECIRIAKLYALSEHPVVFMGESGTEKRMLAESIHNSSRRKSGPFLDVAAEGQSDEEQRKMLFGENGAVCQTQGGTLLIRNVEKLTESNQYRLYQLIRFHVCQDLSVVKSRKVNVRIMVTVQEPMTQLMREEKINRDLYYLLSGLEIAIPPLRERKEDLQEELEQTIHSCCERYAHYHVLTKGAKEALMDYPWYGNLFQVESFCERLILTVGKRTINEVMVKKLLEDLYPPQLMEQEARQLGTSPVQQGGAEEERIRAALQQTGGNREKAARELGVSKATLWRRMKKYRIEF